MLFRSGEDKIRIVDVRVVCATHRSLPEQVRAGTFREDLFYRLYVVPVELPPLHQRGEDVVLIARELLARYALEDGKQLSDFSPDVLAAFNTYAWPGNVRELVNVVRAVVAMHDGPMVQLHMLPTMLRESLPEPKKAALPILLPQELPWFAQDTDSRLAVPATIPITAPSYDPDRVRPLGDLEREAVDYALRAFGGNVARAAQALQVNPSTLYRKIQVWAAQGSMLATADTR